MGQTVQVTTFPSDDHAFAEHVERARERVGTWDPDAIVAEVRRAYPRTTARRASRFATVDSSDHWYVFRDGVAGGRARLESWVQDPTLPSTVLGPDGTYVDANEAAAELFGVDRAAIIGQPAGSFTEHEPDENLGPRLLGTAARAPLVSTALVRRPDGELIPIEFVVQPSGRDGHLVTMRRQD